jgi:hypothetical protein
MLIMIGLDIFDAGAHDFEALQYTSAGGFVWNGTDWVAYVDADFLDYRIVADYDGGGSFSAAAPSGTTHFRLRVRGATLADSPVVYEGEPEEPSSGGADTPSTPTTTTITFVWKVNGVPTDVTSAVLADPTDAYGVERTDNNAVVVVADTPLVKTATGTYAYTFTDPAGGLTYHYYVKVVYGGVTYHVEKQQSGEGSDDSPTTYGTRAGIEGIYGTTNVSGAGGYADVNDNGDADDIAAQIDRARQHAYDWINSKLRGAELDAPATEEAFSEFGLLDDIENERAGAWLYFKRGKNDNDPNGAAQMQWHWDNAEKELDRIIGIVVDAVTPDEPDGGFSFVDLNTPTSACDEFSE